MHFDRVGKHQTFACMRNLTIKRCTSTLSSTATLLRLVSDGSYDQALTFYKQNIHPVQLNTDTSLLIPSIAKACANSQTHQILGLQLHCNVLKNGFDSEFAVSNSILSMYAKFCDTNCAQKVFDGMSERDTVSWNSMINCYTQNGFHVDALRTFRDMYVGGFLPKQELVASCLSTCVKSENWRLGRAMHGLVFVDERVENSFFVSTALVDFYWRFGAPDMAFRVFERIVEKNEVSWTAMISGCAEIRDYVGAFSYVRAMQSENVEPNRVTLISLLPACAGLGSIIHGKEIHGYAVRHGCDVGARFSSALLHMYCECRGGLRTAKLIFDMSRKKNIVMWSSMIAGYSKSERCAREAIRLLNEMQMNGIKPNSVTLLALISACVKLLSLSDGYGVHGYILKFGLGTNLFVQNGLIDMYAKCGSLKDSVEVFDEMVTRDRVSWSALISAYGLYGYAEEALRLFHKMQESGIKADGLIYLAVLTTCNHSGLVDEGRVLFDQALQDPDVCLTIEHYACYIDLLGRAGELEAAYDVMCRMPMKPSTKILSSLVSACKLHGRLDVAESLAHVLVKIDPEDTANSTLLSMVYAESDNWSGVDQVRRHMQDRRLSKNYSFSRIHMDHGSL